MHHNAKIRVPLLDDDPSVLFSFRWMPTMEKNLMELVGRWATDPDDPPFFVLIGKTIHKSDLRSVAPIVFSSKKAYRRT